MKVWQGLAGVLIAATFAATTAVAGPQRQNTPPPAQTQASQPAADQQDSEQTPANVKKGSKADVNAIGNRSVGKGLDFYSLQHEIALGKQLAQEVERSSRFVDDPVITGYVNKVGQNLVRNSDARVPFTIKVIDSDSVNAFALPGGFFYVNSGLILRADDEAELAGVMAHEIAHVAARHGTRNASKAELAQMAMIPLVMLGPGGWAGYGLYEGLNVALPVAFLRFSRADEAEADYLGLQYMYKAGYDPNAFVSFFEKVEAEERREPGTIPKVFNTHPPTPERIVASQKEIATILPARPEYIVDTSEFEQVKHRLALYEQGRKLKEQVPGKPTLKTETAQKGGQNAPDDGRPTLKKRTQDEPH
ncbi:MAG TPA: M48 family metallopeptidase [Candidatus Acidoferrales bacterium]|nr:M48 family metallopeptidase [Candidatus Acidoferrales bacterium]